MAKKQNENKFLKKVKNFMGGDKSTSEANSFSDPILKESVKVFSSSEQPYAVINPQNKILFANKAFKELLSAETLPQNVEDLMDSEDYETFSKCSDDVFSFEDKDGTPFKTVLSLNAAKLKADASIAFLGTGIKDRYASLHIVSAAGANNLETIDSELLRSKNYLEALFVALPFPVFVRTQDGKVISANNPAKLFLGSNGGFTASKKQISKTIFEKDWEVESKIFKTGKPMKITEENVNEKTGTQKFFNVNKVPLRNSSGEILYVLSAVEDISEFKKQENDSKADKELLRSILDYAPLAFYTKDENGKLTFWNKKTTEIFEDTLENETARGSAHETPAQTESYNKREKAVLKEGKAAHYPAEPYTTKSGNKIILDLIKVPIPKSDTSAPCVLTIAQDITEKYLQEQEGGKTSNILQTVFNEAPVAIYARDTKGDIVFRNKKTMEVHGLKSETSDTETEEQKAFYKKRDLSVLKSGKTLYLPEEEYLGSDGKKRIIRAVKSPIYDKDGKPVMVVTIGEDITAEHERETEVLHYKNFLQEIVNNLPVALYAKKYTGEYILWNKKCEELFGKKSEEVIGKTTHNDNINPEQEEFIRMQDQKVFDSKRELDTPQEILSTQDGSVKIMHTVKTPLFLEDGTPNCLLGVSEDITAKSQMERQVYESRTKYSLLVENSREGIIIIEQGKISFANKTLLNALGYDEKEIEGKAFEELAAKSSAQTAREFYDTLSAGAESADVSFIKLKKKTGDTELLFEVSGCVSKYLGKKIVIMFLRPSAAQGAQTFVPVAANAASVTNTAAAVNKQEPFRNVFEASSAPLVVLKNNGYIYDMNKAARDLFGFTAEDKPLYCNIFVKPGLPLKVRQAMQEGKPYMFDGTVDFDRIKKTVSGITKTGKLPLRVSMSPVNEKVSADGSKVYDYLMQLSLKEGMAQAAALNHIDSEDVLTYQDAVLLCSKDGLILKSNARAEQFFGASFSELYAQPLTSLFEEKDKSSIELDIQELYNHGVIKSRDYRTAGKNAGVEVEANAVLAKDNNFLISFRNMSAKRQLMDILDERNQYAHTLVNLLDGALLECDIKDNKFSAFTKANKQAEVFTGYKNSELLKISLKDLLLDPAKKEEKQVENYLALKLQQLQKEKTVSFEAMLNLNEGIRATVVRIGTFNVGGAEKAVVNMRDASKERLLENELQYKAKELRGVKNILPGLYIKLDSNGIIQEYQTAEAGYDISVFSSDYLGHPIQEFLSKEEGETLLENIRQAYESKNPIQTNFSMMNGGEVQFYEASISRLEGEQSVVMLVENIDRRKGLENKIRRLYDFSSGRQTRFVDNMNDILEYGKQIFGAEVGIISHFSGRNRDKILINWATANDYGIKKDIETPVEECFETVRSGHIFACRNTAELRCSRCIHVKKNISSIISAPLYIAGKVEGAISFLSVKAGTMPVTEEDKSFIGFVGGLMSMALEIRQNQKAVDNTLSAMRKLCSSLDVPAAIIDDNLRIKNMNSVMRGICGVYEMAEAENENIFSKFAYDSLKAEGDFKSEYKISKGGLFDFMFDINVADGSKINLLWHVVEIKDGKGAVKGFLLVSESISNIPSLKPFMQEPVYHI